jgi:hypothetical protein
MIRDFLRQALNHFEILWTERACVPVLLWKSIKLSLLLDSFLAYSLALKIAAVHSSKSFLDFYRTVQCHTQKTIFFAVSAARTSDWQWSSTCSCIHIRNVTVTLDAETSSLNEVKISLVKINLWQIVPNISARGDHVIWYVDTHCWGKRHVMKVDKLYFSYC